MKLVINKIPISIIEENNPIVFQTPLVTIEDFRTMLVSAKSVVFRCASIKKLQELIQFCVDYDHEVGHKLHIYLLPEAKSGVEDYIDKSIKFVYTAGGVVYKGEQILLIYRLDRWDLPKGKIEKGEKKKEAAVREVEEECGIRVKLERKLVSSWHLYFRGEKLNIKRTYWYIMSCVEDTNMKPQREEGIEKVEWKSPEELDQCMENTFPNIKMVVEQYKKKAKETEKPIEL